MNRERTITEQSPILLGLLIASLALSESAAAQTPTACLAGGCQTTVREGLQQSDDAAGESRQGRAWRPLVVHAGYAYGGLREDEFQTVRGAFGQDLFSLVSRQDTTDDFMLAVGLQSRPLGADEQIRALASLGTGVEDPGTHIYLGGGVLLFDALAVTGGVVTGNTTHGVQKTVEDVFGGGGTRELFATISTEREWQPYVGVSIKVY